MRVYTDTASDYIIALVIYLGRKKESSRIDSNRIKCRVYLDSKYKDESKKIQKRIKKDYKKEN